MNKNKLLTLLLILIYQTSYSQFKFEREYRVSLKEVPVQAIDFVRKAKFKKKVKWFVEESQEGKTFEAKVNHNGNKHSLEFNEKGEVLDIEVKVKFSSLSETVKGNVSSLFKKRFTKYRIKKVQLQFTGRGEELIKCLQRTCGLQPKFELIVKGKEKKGYQKFEFLLNEEGNKMLRELKFLPDNYDNLEF